MTLLKKIKKLFLTDEYLEYLRKSTNMDWFMVNEKCYWSVNRVYYLERRGDGTVNFTDDGLILPYQTTYGPFCKWKMVNEFEIKKHIK